MKWRLRLSLVTVILFPFHGLANDAVYRPDRSLPSSNSGPLTCDFSAVLGTVAEGTVSIPARGKYHFRFPSSYVDAPYSWFGGGLGSEGTLLFHVDQNSFLPYPPEKRNDGMPWRRGDYLEILVAGFRPLKEIAVLSLPGPLKNLDLTKATIPQDAGPYGLRTLPRTNSTIMPVYYVAESNGQFTELISCSSPEHDRTVRYPSCNQISDLGWLTVQFSYVKSELSRWREYRTAVSSFMKCVLKKEE